MPNWQESDEIQRFDIMMISSAAPADRRSFGWLAWKLLDKGK
jgi:hypothetical protein